MINFYNEILEENKIKILDPCSKEKIDFIIPNSYYINSKGFLYNSLSENGEYHKGTKLIYPYNDIKSSFYGEKFCRLDGLHTIILEDKLQSAIETYNRIISDNAFDSFDVKCYINMLCTDYNDPLLMKLMLGIITSKIALLEKFIEIKNTSVDHKKIMDKIIEESNDDISDILVRLCGFHKIESQVDRTITTSSLNINDFKNYLDRDFKLTIIPPILFNREYDDLYEQIVVDKFLDKNPEYDGKILTRKYIDKRR